MSIPAGKPLSHLSVHLRSWGAMALPVKAIRQGMAFDAKMNRVLAVSHVFLLCRRPAFSFNPDSFSWSDGRVSGDLVCTADGVKKSFPFAFDWPLNEGETGVTLSPFPHDELCTFNAKGECVRRLGAMGLSQHPDILEKDRSINDLEVLYVGNVFSEDGSPVFDRICRNAPLQRFLDTVQAAMPDDDLIVYAFEYLPYELVTLPGSLQHASVQEAHGDARFVSVREHPLSEHQKICLAQAGLIHYFQPSWQERGDDVLPHPDQPVFEACESLDMAGLVVELSTVRSHFRLCTPHSALLPHHMTMIGLSDAAERAAFFAIRV